MLYTHQCDYIIMASIQKKCTVCGCTELVPMKFAELSGEPGVFLELKADAFACVKCGHMEFFAKEAEIRNSIVQNEIRVETEQKRAAAEKELAEAKAELEKAESIVNDETQEFKAIKAAQERISVLKQRIKELETFLR